jgi:Fungal chitosanase of glycosyl hydrolase group 75
MSRETVVHFGSNLILQLSDKPGVLFWTCPLAVDADGHPQCYHPQGSPPGLDYLANAGSPGNWWGIATSSSGTPHVQKDSDPAPGFYVSTTALEDHTLGASNPNRYVHSGKVPFFVLPSSPKFSPNQRLGDLAMFFNNDSGKYSWAIYADIGPAKQIGEGSMALAAALGLSDSPKSGGTDKEVIAAIYFPGSAVGWPRSSDELSAKAYDLFNAWGGYDSAKIALPQINWDQFPPIPTPTQKV